MSSAVLPSLEYPFAELPAAGTTLEVAPGVRWLLGSGLGVEGTLQVPFTQLWVAVQQLSGPQPVVPAVQLLLLTHAPSLQDWVALSQQRPAEPHLVWFAWQPVPSHLLVPVVQVFG